MSEAIDRLSSLLERFRVHAQLFHAGPLCGVSHFPAQPGRAFLHVLRRGEMVVTHPAGSGAPQRLDVRGPSLLFYPRPLSHDFHNPPVDGADFVCATLDFEGGAQQSLVRALPPLVLVPLHSVPGLEGTLALLFAETERLRCGQRILADRLLEVLLLQLLRWLLDHPGETGVSPGLIQALSHPKLARALTALHDRPGEPWSLAAMAAVAGMSRSAFAAAFRDGMGQTPADYLAQWRLSLAQQRLRAGMPVKRVAHDLGYASASSLSRSFTQHLGQSPRRWLQAMAAPASA